MIHDDFAHAIRIVFRGDVAIHASPVVNVVEFFPTPSTGNIFIGEARPAASAWASSTARNRGGVPCVENALARRRNGRAITRPTPVFPVEQFARDLADAVQLRNRDHLFMRGDLETRCRPDVLYTIG